LLNIAKVLKQLFVKIKSLKNKCWYLEVFKYSVCNALYLDQLFNLLKRMNKKMKLSIYYFFLKSLACCFFLKAVFKLIP